MLELLRLEQSEHTISSFAPSYKKSVQLAKIEPV